MTDLVHRLRTRATIRRQIPSRRSVKNNETDRLADLLDEAADEISRLSHFMYEIIGGHPQYITPLKERALEAKHIGATDE